MRVRIAIVLLVASCTGRPFVDVSDEGDGTTTGTPPPPADEGVLDENSGIFSVSDHGEVGEVDDGSDSTDTEPAIPCTDSAIADVVVSVWPGRDPVNDESDFVVGDYDCAVDVSSDFPAQIRLRLECTDASVPLADIVDISVEAEGIAVPAQLVDGAMVQARVYTWRDGKHYAEYPWRSADHFAIYRDGALLFAGGSGVSFPTDENGESDPAFFEPVFPNVRASGCPGPVLECHDTYRSAWEIGVDDELVLVPPFSLVQVGGFDLHLGELSTSDSNACGEPVYGRVAFALARP